MKKSMTRKERANEVSEATHELMSDIVKSDLNPEEDSSLFTHMNGLFLKEIMNNTAIIADYIIEKQLKGGTN